MFFAIVAKEIIEKKLCQKITKKYRKNRKNNKSSKNQDLEKKEAKKGPEMSANIANYRKSNKDFCCVLKTPVTNIAKIAKTTNLTKFQT